MDFRKKALNGVLNVALLIELEVRSQEKPVDDSLNVTISVYSVDCFSKIS